MTGDTLDLAPLARDALLLELPLAPLCRDDCAGLCPTAAPTSTSSPATAPARRPVDPDPLRAALDDAAGGLPGDGRPGGWVAQVARVAWAPVALEFGGAERRPGDGHGPDSA